MTGAGEMIRRLWFVLKVEQERTAASCDGGRRLRHRPPEFGVVAKEDAPIEGIDPLGWYLPPFAYANLQVLGEAIEGAKSLDQTKLADYIRSHSFNTIVGEIAFGKDGEWAKPRVLEVQFQGILGTDLEHLLKDTRTEVILEPEEFRTGEVVEPYSSVKK